MAVQNVSKMTKMQVNPSRPGSNAGARGGRPVGYSGGKRGSNTGLGKSGASRSTGVNLKKSGAINLGSNR